MTQLLSAEPEFPPPRQAWLQSPGCQFPEISKGLSWAWPRKSQSLQVGIVTRGGAWMLSDIPWASVTEADRPCLQLGGRAAVSAGAPPWFPALQSLRSQLAWGLLVLLIRDSPDPAAPSAALRCA